MTSGASSIDFVIFCAFFCNSNALPSTNMNYKEVTWEKRKEISGKKQGSW